MKKAGAAVLALALLVAIVLAIPLAAAATSRACGAGGGSGSVKGHQVPAALAADAAQAAQRGGVDTTVVLALAWGETGWGSAHAGVGEAEVRGWLGDLAGDVDLAALQAGGGTALQVGRPAGVPLGDWTNRQPVGDGEHAIGFMQFIPSTWRGEAKRHPKPGGGHWDPYAPLDAMSLAGYYFAEILAGNGHDVGKAFDTYGTGAAGRAALAELQSTWQAAAGAACAAAGDLVGAAAGVANGLWPVELPVRHQKVQHPIPVPAWPAGFHPSAVSPQCFAGALWVFGLLHPQWIGRFGDFGGLYDAAQMYDAAARAGWRVSQAPVVGSMFILGAGYAGTGHVGVVTAISDDGQWWDTVEQNADGSAGGDLSAHWGHWSVGTHQVGRDFLAGFIVSPPGA